MLASAQNMGLKEALILQNRPKSSLNWNQPNKAHSEAIAMSSLETWALAIISSCFATVPVTPVVRSSWRASQTLLVSLARKEPKAPGLLVARVNPNYSPCTCHSLPMTEQRITVPSAGDVLAAGLLCPRPTWPALVGGQGSK